MLVSHLSLSSDARDRSFREIGEFSQKISQLPDSSYTIPTILVGDFNAVISSSNELATTYGFDDVWSVLQQRDKPTDSTGFTFSSWNPHKRIDYVFSRFLTPLSFSLLGMCCTRARSVCVTVLSRCIASSASFCVLSRPHAQFDTSLDFVL